MVGVCSRAASGRRRDRRGGDRQDLRDRRRSRGWAAAGSRCALRRRPGAPPTRWWRGAWSDQHRSLLVELDRGRRRAAPRRAVLLIDEAGMVDSASLARLIDQVERSEAKLVLVGDPRSSGDRGRRPSRALAHADPIDLDEVIRHRHEAGPRGGQAHPRGTGARALEPYRPRSGWSSPPTPRRDGRRWSRDWRRPRAGRGRDDDRQAKRRGRGG